MAESKLMDPSPPNSSFAVINVQNGTVRLIKILVSIRIRRTASNKCLFISADIYDEVSGPIRTLGLDTECLGGGRIEHHPESKLLKVYGHSTVSFHLDCGSRRHECRFLLLMFVDVIDFRVLGKLIIRKVVAFCSPSIRITKSRYPTRDIEVKASKVSVHFL